MSVRPSRQELVVPRKQSTAVLLIGAAASGLVGFAAVWALGVGRSSSEGDGGVLTLPVTTVGGPALEVAQSSEPDRFAPAGSPGPAAGPAPDRYGVQPTSLEAPSNVIPTAGADRAVSRFSVEPPAGEPLAVAEPTDLRSPPQTGGDVPPPDPPLESGPAPEPEPRASSPDDEPATSTSTDLDPETSAGDSVSGPGESLRPAPNAADPAPGEPAIPADPAPPSASRFTPPAAFPTSDQVHVPTAPIPQRGDVAANAGTNPLRTPNATLAAAVPFATAPPLGPPPARPVQPPFPTPGDPGPAAGQGRPGPAHLEGVQSPQVTVEKRGPREVQVGKSARYEILVRNVGSATANDVVLRDSVPYGTALVTTTPPASPGNPAADASGGDLAWMLGSLPPGGQARVAMEVMPRLEGDIGSVASVTFRAEASIRSRATKPDLRIDVVDPKPVLIGRDIKLPITISNPGSGVATGVVLEGALPDPLTHRAGKELEFDVGQLQPGGSRTIELSLGSKGPGMHSVRLVARADGQIESERSVQVEVTAPALELAADMPARRYLQRPAVCRISMANAGTASAKSVELAAQLPPGLKFVRANNAGYYDERTHRVLWNLEELPAADRGVVELVVMPVDLGPQKIVAAARSADGLSDQISNTIEVEGLAAVTFDVTDSEDPIEVAGVTEYVIRVGNQGTKAASGVRVAATILGELEPIEARGPAGHRIDNLTVSFEPLARLAPTEEAVFRIRVRGNRPGDQRVQVQLTTDDHPAPITKEEITRVYADK